jgi:hypothetical protein
VNTHKETFHLKHITLIGGLGLFLLMAVPSIGSDQPPPSNNQEQVGLIGMKADLKIILHDSFGRLSSSEHKLYKAGMRVRIEPLSIGTPDLNLPDEQRQTGAYEDVYIYDYVNRKQYRLILSDKIYFETTISQSGLIEAQRDGLIPLEEYPNVEVEKPKLAETTFDGHPCRLYLQVRSLTATEESKQKKKRLAVEYILLWEATDLGNLPVRIVYTGPDYITKIVEYRNVRIEPVDASLFQPPKGFPSMSPF